MIELRPITVDELPADFTERSSVKIDFSDAKGVLSETTSMWEISGRDSYGILGAVQSSLLSRQTFMWLIWYEEAKTCLSDWKEAPKALANLAKENQLDFWAAVDVTNPKALKFAKYMGFREVEQRDGFHICKGIF